jgi:hypothetical protein
VLTKGQMVSIRVQGFDLIRLGLGYRL